MHTEEQLDLPYRNHPRNIRFKRIRKDLLHLTQKEFADRLSVKQGTVSDIERGRLQVPKALAEKIVTIFRVNSGWFYSELDDIFIVPNQGSESGLNQGFGQKKEILRINDKEERVLRDFGGKSDFDRKYAIAKRLIWENHANQKEYYEFTEFINTIENFEPVLNCVENSKSIHKLLNPKELSKDLEGLTYDESKEYFYNCIEKYKPYFHIFGELEQALVKFAKQLKEIPDSVSDISKDELDFFLRMSS